MSSRGSKCKRERRATPLLSEQLLFHPCQFSSVAFSFFSFFFLFAPDWTPKSKRCPAIRPPNECRRLSDECITDLDCGSLFFGSPLYPPFLPLFFLPLSFFLSLQNIGFDPFAFPCARYSGTRTEIKGWQGRMRHAVLAAVCFSSSSAFALEVVWHCVLNRFAACVSSMGCVFRFHEKRRSI